MKEHYDLGYDCARTGGRLDDCPYHYECEEKDQWGDGFMQYIRDDLNHMESLDSFLERIKKEKDNE